jgi:prepilin signal peptidase PulO-like enzyme (type II secretory pathway)
VRTGTLAGDAAAALCTALSAATLGRLLAGGVPVAYLKLAIVAFAVIDAILVFGNQLQGPNAVLNAAVPAEGLPQLQFLNLHHASMGYGDVFVAGVLGGVLAVEGRRQWTVGLLVFALAAAWDLLFLLDSINTLPATVPIAVALIAVEVRPWLTRRRPGISSASS